METRQPAPDIAAAEEDDQLLRVLDEYLAELEAGAAQDPHQLLADHPELAPRLRACLAGLQLLDAAAPPAEAPFSQLGAYRIVREIGRGGMGIVYEATRRGDGQRVALKILPFAASLNPRQLQRFKNEAHAASHLHHPHIVPVYEVGCAGGVHYYTMKFIEGTSLAALWRRMRREARSQGARRAATSETLAIAEDFTRDAARPSVPPSYSLNCIRQAASWAQQAALALEHAHQVGVIHRDIKLGNLLVDDAGHLWVADFGLASVQGGDGLTATGDLVGTFRYMSPEQASARRGVVDHRTDIYSLGVSLYELLTLRQAFEGRDRQELLSQVAAEEPRGVRRLNPAIPADLETIVLTAMAKAPEERYATARALADDLGRFLAGEPVHARRPGLPVLALKWARNHRAWVTVISLFVFVTALGLAAIWGALRAEAKQRALAQVRELDSRRHLYAAQMNLALEDWNSGHVARVFELLDRQRPAPGQTDLRDFEWHHLRRLCEHAGCGRLPGDGKPVYALAAATNGAVFASAGESGTIYLWDPVTLARRAAIPALGGPIRGLAISPGGDLLAAGCGDCAVRIWNLTTFELHATLTGHSGELGVGAVAFSPDGQTLVSAGLGDGFVRIWNTSDWQPRAVPQGHSYAVNCLAVSPDGSTLASGSNDRKVLLWDLTAANIEPKLLGEHRVYVHSLAFSADGKTLVSGSEDGFVRLWDVQTRQPKGMLRRHTGAVVGAAFSKNDQLATVSWDGSVKVWNPETQEISLQQGHPGQVFAVAITPDGRRLLSAGDDADVRVWDLASDPEPLVLTCDKGLIRGLTFSPDSRRIASAGNDRTARIWDLSRPHEPLVLGQHAEWGMGAAFSRDGRQLFTADYGGNITLWDAQTGSQVDEFEPAGGPLWSLALAGDETRLAGAGYTSNVIYLWDAVTRMKLAPLVGHEERIWSVAFTPDGRLVASSGNDRTVRVWNAAAGEQIASIPVSEKWVFAITFSPDGKTLAIAGGDRRVHFWDLATRKLREPLGLHPAGLRALAYLPDGQTLVTGNDDGAVRLWDLATRQERATLRVQASSVWSVAVAPDGQAIAAGDGDGKITVWRAIPP